MAKTIQKASISSDRNSTEELPDLWRKSIEPYFDAEPIDRHKNNRNLPYIYQHNLGKFIFLHCGFGEQIFTRDRYWMHQHDDVDHLLLQFFERGENKVVNGTHSYTENSENIYAVNLSQTIKAQSTESQVLILALPRKLILDKLPHLANACGALFQPKGFSARIFIDYMKSLRDNLPYARSEDAQAIVESTLGLLGSLTLHDVDASSASTAAFQTACRHIERHLGDPDLAVDSICRHLSCSRATLYRLFKPHGGVHQHIQRRRLAACFKAILSPRYRRRRIYDIALDFGFTSPSHFSSLFRSHFGMTPSEARDKGNPLPAVPMPAPGAAADDDTERMWTWAKTLARQVN